MKHQQSGYPTAPVRLRDPSGRVYTFPFRKCRQWNDIHELIIGACGYLEDIGPAVRAGEYELVTKDGATVWPEEWEESVGPGWELGLRVKDVRGGRWREV